MYPAVLHPKWAASALVEAPPVAAEPTAPQAAEPDEAAAVRSRRARHWARRGGWVVGLAGWLVVVAGILVLLVPSLLGYDRYVIVSGSMRPLLDRGSVVFSKERPVEQLEVGDVITYTPPPASGVDHLVTHRITSIEVDDEGRRVFRTQGDANEFEDPWTFQLLKGDQNVMRGSVPLLGYVFIALSDPHLRMLVIGIPAGIIALIALVDVIGISLGRPRWVDAT